MPLGSPGHQGGLRAGDKPATPLNLPKRAEQRERLCHETKGAAWEGRRVGKAAERAGWPGQKREGPQGTRQEVFPWLGADRAELRGGLWARLLSSCCEAATPWG